MSNFKKIILFLWFLFLVGIWFYYFKNPVFFSRDGLYIFFQKFGNYIVFAYIIFSCFRGIFLLPSTILIFVGALFLNPFSLFFISILAIIFSSSLVYFFGDFLGIDKEIKNPKYKKKIQKLKKSINKNGFLIIVLWSLFPFVPNDFICYIAGTVNMKYSKFILGVILGETPLVFFYVLISFEIFNFF